MPGPETRQRLLRHIALEEGPASRQGARHGIHQRDSFDTAA